MIKKLKKKFIILATVSMLVLMTVLILVMNLVNYRTVVVESDKVLNILKETSERMDGGFPPDGPRKDGEERDWDEKDWDDDMRGQGGMFGLSPEAQYEARFFEAEISADGQVVRLDTSRIIAVDSDDAEEYIQKALGSSKEKGFIGDFRFVKTDSGDSGGMKIIFLDCGRRLAAFHRFMLISILIGVAGCIIVFLVFLFAAGRIIRPIAESYEKQKRFITDAGHEIKTPLTIIAANVDLLKEDIGENESIDDIADQTERLSELTKDLVFLSKMEEPDRQLVKVDFPVSDLVSETAASFAAVAQAQKKEYQINVQPSLTMNGAPDEIRRLTSILIENAMKYSPEGGSVKVDLEMQKKNIVLSVFNTTFEPMAQQDLSRLFERFYRTDASRNSETGGHGIGLSIAKAITENHGGKITASTSGGSDFCITAVLPQ
ncbi:MAG: GHKL domain-containing protein [Parasporobacterium sp.]|nr:GHKL domain-containing protein [Lachnospiraceae bacterium]MBR3644495.1 GHKL domain-containing protein [Parasporobacterium sp.]